MDQGPSILGKKTGQLLATVGLFLGLLGIISWIFDLSILTSILPEYVPTSPETAYVIFMIALALLSYFHQSSGKFTRFTLAAAAFFALIFGIGSLIQFFGNSS